MSEVRARLVNQAEDEVMACIGCNDCLLACPLPETTLVSIAQLNDAVQRPVINDEAVIQFVTACTQCRQCVPVCPADLSRADMVLVNKLKVEDAAPDMKLHLQVGERVQPSGWTLAGLASHVATMPLFNGVGVADMRRTLLKSTLRQLAPGEVLCREGTYHERLFVVVDGSVEQTAAGPDGRSQRILVLGPGSFHGETAVIANQVEQYTVVARQESVVIEIPKTALYQLMSLAPSFDALMKELYRRHALWTHARQAPALAGLPEAALEALLESAELVSLEAGEGLYEEGDAPDAFYIVRNGFLRVSRRFGAAERVLLYFREGDLFGALPLLVGGHRTVTVSANTRADLIRLPAVALTAVLERHPAARRRLIDAALAAEKMPTPKPPPSGRGPGVGPPANTTQLGLSWTGLIDKGVLQGHEVLVIDQSVCTNCNNCVDACGRRHGYSRLERRGLQLGSLLFPTACRHCEDPVCLLCSVNGIIRLPDGEIAIVDDNCIGCGSCAERCPYGNIRMHNVRETPAREENWLLGLWHALRGTDPAPPELDPERPQVAVKCDLCAGYSDYACVTACPVGAAFRIDPVQAFEREQLLIGLEMRRKEPVA